MANPSDYPYEERWKPKRFWTRQKALIGAAVVVILFIGLNLIPQWLAPSPTDPTPTPAYIEYGSRRIASVIPQEVEFPAPALELIDQTGAAVALEDYRGQVLLLNMWATWCPGCVAEMPELEAYYQARQADGLLVIGLNAEDSAAEIDAFRQKMGLSFPLWRDAKKHIYNAFNNNHLPSSYVVDRTGMVRLAWYGPISLEILEEFITPLLQE